MKLYILTTYQYDTYSYTGLSEWDRFIFKSKEAAIKYGKDKLKLTYLDNSDLAFDQESDCHFTVEEDETVD